MPCKEANASPLLCQPPFPQGPSKYFFGSQGKRSPQPLPCQREALAVAEGAINQRPAAFNWAPGLSLPTPCEMLLQELQTALEKVNFKAHSEIVKQAEKGPRHFHLKLQGRGSAPPPRSAFFRLEFRVQRSSWHSCQRSLQLDGGSPILRLQGRAGVREALPLAPCGTAGESRGLSLHICKSF